MNMPDLRIIRFLKEHHVLSIATCVDNRPWCASCFYVFMENEVGFVFTSDIESRHIQEALTNVNVAGTVVLESEIAGKMQGVQFEGRLKILDQALTQKAKMVYVKKYPMTSLMQTSLWFLEISSFKFTDNRLFPGNKVFWKR